jgi:hypothetical protein
VEGITISDEEDQLRDEVVDPFKTEAPKPEIPNASQVEKEA